MRPYSSVKSLCGLSYICFSGTPVLGQLGETGPEYPKSPCAAGHMKSNSKSSAPYSTSNETFP